MTMLEEIISSKTRAEVFRLLFTDLMPEIYLRDLARRSNSSLTPIKTELGKLVRLDLVEMRKDGNRTYYKANGEHPIFSEIKNLVDKTCGYIYAIQKKLEKKKIEFAFIFGSIAKGEERALSDIDLFIIGELGLREVTNLLTGIQERIEREINPHVYSRKNFINNYKKANNFVINVVKNDKIFLVGSEHELKKLIRK